MAALDRFIKTYVRFVEYFITFLLTLLVLDAFAQVVWRYVLNDPLIWTEEVARFLFIWVVFVGACLPLEKKRHFVVRFFMNMTPPLARRIAEGFSNLVIIAVLSVMIREGFPLALANMAQASPALRFPFGPVYAAIPIGACLMLPIAIRDLAIAIKPNLEPEVRLFEAHVNIAEQMLPSDMEPVNVAHGEEVK